MTGSEQWQLACRGSCRSSWQRRLCETLSWQVARQWRDVVDLVVMTVSRNGPRDTKYFWDFKRETLDLSVLWIPVYNGHSSHFIGIHCFLNKMKCFRERYNAIEYNSITIMWSLVLYKYMYNQNRGPKTQYGLLYTPR